MVDSIQEISDQVVEQVGSYGELIAESLGIFAIGALLVYLLSRLVRRLFGAYMTDQRLPIVIFGTLYALVLVLTVAIVLKQAGLDVSRLAPIAILVLLVLAVLVYFLMPYLPKLPFLPGDTIESGGVMGSVDSISPFNTAIRKFDGTVVYIPNAMIMASRISNFSHIPNRRIEMGLTVAPDSDLPVVRERMLALMSADSRVLDDPAPRVLAGGVDALGVKLTLQYWVKNADFVGTRSDLWFELVQLTRQEADIDLAVERHEVFLRRQS